jgi:hypothetical protein
MSATGTPTLEQLGASSTPYLFRLLFLIVGTVWGLAACMVVTHLHVNPEHLANEAGQPIFRTVYARDPGLWKANFVGIGLVVLAAALELLIRWQHKSSATGVVATVLGSALCVYSLFGLLYGIAGVAPIGVMLILSGRRVTNQRAAVGN